MDIDQFPLSAADFFLQKYHHAYQSLSALSDSSVATTELQIKE
jgi:hypothetical protein